MKFTSAQDRLKLNYKCGPFSYSLTYICSPPQMQLMQKAIDANPMMEGRQRRRKRYVGPESLETQVKRCSSQKDSNELI